MKRKLIYFGLVILLSSCTNTPKKNNTGFEKEKVENHLLKEVKMKPEVLLGKRVEMSLSSEFVRMSDDEVKIIYPEASRRPDVIFKNTDGTANISLQHTKKRVVPSELPSVLEQLTSQYKKNPTIEFIDSRFESINGDDYVVLEFISQGENKRVYNLMLITSLEEKIMMSSFSCAMPVIGDWMEKGNRIIRTIKLL